MLTEGVEFTASDSQESRYLVGIRRNLQLDKDVSGMQARSHAQNFSSWFKKQTKKDPDPSFRGIGS